MITGGIDVGAETVKAAICADKELIGWGIVKTGLDRKGSANKALKLAERAGGLSAKSVQYLVATGSGRKTIDIADTHISDIIATANL